MQVKQQQPLPLAAMLQMIQGQRDYPRGLDPLP